MQRRLLLTEDEKAISIVIGVVLMVSVAAAMAAVGYAYITGMIGSGPEEEPAIVDFYADYEDNTLTFTYMDRDNDWEDLSIMLLQGSSSVPFDTGNTGEINVGQKINLNGNGLVQGTVGVTITHLPSETMVGDYTFEDVILL